MRFFLFALFSFSLFAIPLRAQDAPLDLWVAALKQEALARGVSASLFDYALAGFEPLPGVIELDRKQPEKTRSFAQYVSGTVSVARIAKGRALLQEHRALLDGIASRYGVPAHYIVALWGMETNYGENTGGFPVIDSLATLAHDGRRSAFFREELLQALQILNDGHIAVDDMTGSWAGAMGQCQFMPSSYRKFAVDENRDGKKDIWHTREDVFASIANYLSSSGWNAATSWGREVRLPEGFDPALADIKVKRPASEWAAMGVTGKNGEEMASSNEPVAIVYPDDSRTSAYMVTVNYDVIMTWNKSRYFATSVGMLADALAL